jgi:uncharacterized protein (UPF0212 family)
MGFFSLFRKKEGSAGDVARAGSGIDPGLKYCPQCGDEYRAEILRCAGCAVDLITGAQRLAMEQARSLGRASRSMEIAAGETLVILRSGQLKDLKLLRKQLADEGIPSIIGGEGGACCSSGCRGGPELQLQVREADARDALAVLASVFRESTALHDHDLTHLQAAFNPGTAADRCPACGTRFAVETAICPECGLNVG